MSQVKLFAFHFNADLIQSQCEDKEKQIDFIIIVANSTQSQKLVERGISSL